MSERKYNGYSVRGAPLDEKELAVVETLKSMGISEENAVAEVVETGRRIQHAEGCVSKGVWTVEDGAEYVRTDSNRHCRILMD